MARPPAPPSSAVSSLANSAPPATSSSSTPPPPSSLLAQPMTQKPPPHEPPALVSPALEHMLMYGERRELTEEELARAIRIDPSQIAGLGPSIEALLAMLRERKRKILAKYETRKARERAHIAFHMAAAETK